MKVIMKDKDGVVQSRYINPENFCEETMVRGLEENEKEN